MTRRGATAGHHFTGDVIVPLFIGAIAAPPVTPPAAHIAQASAPPSMSSPPTGTSNPAFRHHLPPPHRLASTCQPGRLYGSAANASHAGRAPAFPHLPSAPSSRCITDEDVIASHTNNLFVLLLVFSHLNCAFTPVFLCLTLGPAGRSVDILGQARRHPFIQPQWHVCVRSSTPPEQCCGAARSLTTSQHARPEV